jgi:uncharacterized membrane protein SpoIIM required for sporulation
MDVDRFIRRNQDTWDRLAVLTERVRRSPRGVSPQELDELVQLYQRTSTHLSHARTYDTDPATVNRLTRLVADAGAVVYGRRPRTARTLGRFFTHTFPASVWYARRAVLAAALLLFVPVVVMIVWLTNSPEALDATASEAQRQVIVDEAFESYYSEQPSAQFAALVGVNNIYVSFLAFVLGTLFVVPGAFVVVNNGLHIGQVGAIMTAEGEADVFWTLIMPHGLLELSAIVLAAGAGIWLGWTWIAPGDRTRADALGEEGRRVGAMILGIVLLFVIAALIEGFVTGSALPIQVRIGIGATVWLAVVVYLVERGRAAVAAGSTGQLGEFDR